MTQTNFSLPAHLSAAFDLVNSNPNNVATDNTSASDYTFIGDAMQNATSVERELECQICLSRLETPILLACNAHSLCLDCIKGLFEHQKKVRGGKKNICCPTCGTDSGSISLKKIEEFRVNKELERVMQAYEKEKKMWFEEKYDLKQQLFGLLSIQEEENNKKLKTETNNRKGLANEEEECLRDILESFGARKLKQVEKMIQESLKAKEEEKATKEASKAKVQKKNSKSTKASEKGQNENEKDGESDAEEADNNKEKKGTRKKGGSQTKLIAYMGIGPVKKGRPSKKNTMDVEVKETKEYGLRNGIKKLKTM